MRVAVVGGSGRLGRVIRSSLSSRPSSLPARSIERLELDERLRTKQSFEGFQALVIALGSGHFASTRAFECDGLLVQAVIAAACQSPSVETVILVSCFGVDDFSHWTRDELAAHGVVSAMSDAPGCTRPEVLHWKRESEMALRAATTTASSTTKHLIVRCPPTLDFDGKPAAAGVVVPCDPGTHGARAKERASAAGVAGFVGGAIHRHLSGTVELSSSLTASCAWGREEGAARRVPVEC